MLNKRNGCRPENQDRDADDGDFDLTALISARFHLTPNVARLVIEHAGLGTCGDHRATAGKSA
jgi:hypothetical protein